MTRSRHALLAIGVLLALSLVASGCGKKTETSTTGSGESTSTSEPTAKPSAVRIGTLATEDSLPLWVAENMGYFSTEGLSDVKITLFQSAQERDAAFSSGAIDAYMGDIIAAANLEAAGSKNTIKTIMLGADQSQGRFGVATSPKNDDVTAGPNEGMKQLAGEKVGTSSATIQEYVLDGLMSEQGVPAAQVEKEEVKKVPVRFELLMANKLKAAALPEPFLTLAEQGGAKLVGDDTKAQKNLSQTVLVFSDTYLATPGGAAAADAVLRAWDVAVGDINKAPDAYRKTLVEKARLPKPLETTYKVNTYPTAQVPSQADVDAVLSWMKTKGYLKGDVSYADLVSQ
jgi:NitT/TauT family transport system substrate-binding protein